MKTTFIKKAFNPRLALQHLQSNWLIFTIGGPVFLTMLSLHIAPLFGIGLAMASILFLLTFSVFYEPARKLSLAAAIIPTSFLVVASLGTTSYASQIAILYSSVLVLATLYRFWLIPATASTKNSHGQRLKEYAVFIPQTIVAGQLLAALIFLAVAHTQPFPDVSPVVLIGSVTAMALIEVIYFQGLLQHVAHELGGKKYGALLTFVLFVSFLGFGSWGELLAAVLAGGAVTAAYYVKSSVIPALFTNVFIKLAFIALVAIA